jgi:hypothetical protein
MNICLLKIVSKKLRTFIAHSEEYLKKAFVKYKHEHPESDMLYDHFKEIRSRDQVQIRHLQLI